MKKLDINKIVEKMKEGVKGAKVAPKESPNISKVKDAGVRVRDMRQEAMDLGAHSARDYFYEEGAKEK